MATGPVNKAIEALHRAALLPDGAGLSDGQLLAAFLDRRDEAAFETLLRRHAPMVLGVCRRVLARGQDVEDAFQATFLVLVRKAAAVRPREAVANWLYGVAYRTALKARATAARRAAREKQVTAMPDPEAARQDPWDDLAPVLDQELSRLPDNYRLPVVLCELEGKTEKEAARQLGWPEGTLSGRLSRARKLLAARLTRRGVGVSAAALAAALPRHAAGAAVPAAQLTAALKAAWAWASAPGAAAGAVSANVAALAQGVLNAMLLSKLRSTLTVLIVTGAAALACGAFVAAQTEGNGGGAGAPAVRGAAPRGADGPAPARTAPGKKVRGVTLAEIQGKWQGARDRVEVKLAVEGKLASFTVSQQVPNPLDPKHTPVVEHISANLVEVTEDAKAGWVDFRMHYAETDKNGRRTGKEGVWHWGRMQRAADGNVTLRIFPVSRYRPVDGLVLRRPSQAEKEKGEGAAGTEDKWAYKLTFQPLLVAAGAAPANGPTLEALMATPRDLSLVPGGHVWKWRYRAAKPYKIISLRFVRGTRKPSGEFERHVITGSSYAAGNVRQADEAFVVCGDEGGGLRLGVALGGGSHAGTYPQVKTADYTHATPGNAPTRIGTVYVLLARYRGDGPVRRLEDLEAYLAVEITTE